MNKEVYELLNNQINKELYSAYLYLSFADYYAEEGLDGFAHWYEVQAAEERDHALILRRYLLDSGESVSLLPIPKPDKVFENYMHPLEEGLKHEKYVTGLIHQISAAAHKSNDFRTLQFIQWFIDEQREEETNANDLINKMRLFGKDPQGLYQLNQEYAARVYTTASPLAGK